MKIAAVLLCAGEGERFNGSIPKQFITLHEKKIYRYALDTLQDSNIFSEIFLVVGNDHDKYLDLHNDITIIEGGKTRQESLFLTLKAMNNIDYVMICDGVRPFLTKKLIDAHIKKLKEGEIAVNTCIPCTDTINIVKDGQIKAIPNRDQFLKGQTPQSFSFKELFFAHQHTDKHYTDDCAIILDAGKKVSYVLGSEENIKITSPIDLELARITS